MVNLIMHCGGHHVSRDAVQNAPTPERTNTWVPIPHNRLLEIAEATIEQQGYTVTNQVHGLWDEGARYFGLLELADQMLQMVVLVQSRVGFAVPLQLAILQVV